MSEDTATCHRCGALLGDVDAHNSWHEQTLTDLQTIIDSASDAVRVLTDRQNTFADNVRKAFRNLQQRQP